ncbi:hypothetical protein IQ215_08095 [Cyanobacterium stanieri LEGE 03274]|uniref:asparagine synthase (glutamine-hydrolyzing) n=1 Tax=Cyanobacterium stanieri LEGE 03274 TaxID=1828756 RepID=A0ABR9V436_9CHRO|nr:asparagine synthase-related protein [Cyanobacterium stanieri]MBE9222658.1 hypothetical protein [Cyanobacterium stanieri LEGE 03274]
MPGIFGFTRGDDLYGSSVETLERMQDILFHQSFYEKDSLFVDENIAASRCDLNVLQKQPQPYHQNGIFIWFSGEFYNQKELLNCLLDKQFNNDLELLYNLYCTNKSLSFLKDIDGLYSAVIYDTVTNKLHLISDRYGWKHLYWTTYKESLVWGCEAKVILELPNFTPEIDSLAVEEFLSLRHFIGNRTWFKDVQLLSASTILTYDLDTKSISQRRYWWWNQIKPLSGKINEKEIAQELGRLFINCVERQSENGKVGLTLSGGLDSRFILASMPNNPDSIHAVSFMGEDEIKIAAQVAKVKGADFHPLVTNRENHLVDFCQAVWWADGECSLKQQFIYPFQSIRNNSWFDINLHGMAGGGVVGGSLLFDSDKFIDNYVIKKLKISPNNQSLIESLTSAFQVNDYDSHIFCMDNRVRCFGIRMAKLNRFLGVENRFPFANNKFQELLYSVPNELKVNNQLYAKILLMYFPKFYKSIPWQSTGEPIGSPSIMKLFLKKTRNFEYKLNRKLNKFTNLEINLVNKNKKKSTKNQKINSSDLISQEPVFSLFNEIINDPNPMYCNYVKDYNLKHLWKEHLEGKNRWEIISRLLTLEIWLQQVFNNKYKS